MRYQQPFGITDPNAPYINGNPSTGTMGSIPPAASIEHPQREIVRMINAAGITPADGSLDQLALAIQRGKVNFATDTGSVNGVILVLDPTPSVITGMRLWFKKQGGSSTGPTTINLNGTISPILRNNGTPTESGDLFNNGIFGTAWDGAGWRIVAGLSFETTISNAFLSGVAFPQEIRHIGPSSGNWTVPAGVYVAEGHVYGAGAGGGTGHATFCGGGGGGGGGYSRRKLAVVPGAVMPWVAGGGGAGGGPEGSTTGGTSGGSSSFGGMSVTGGYGGNAGVNPIPGLPSFDSGVGAGGDINLRGGYGSSGASGANTNGQFTGYGGLGGGGPGPEGGVGGTMSTGGAGPGIGLGAGGSGGGSAAGINSVGGPGAPGAVLIRYVQPA